MLLEAPKGHVHLVNSSTKESSTLSNAEHLHVLYVVVSVIHKICTKCLLQQVIAARAAELISRHTSASGSEQSRLEKEEAGKAPRRAQCHIRAH